MGRLLILGAVGAAAIGVACAGPPTVSDASGTDSGTGSDSGPTRIPESEAFALREACTFDRGALARDTIGAEWPVGEDIPIDYFILLMQENRSMDSYFATFPGVDPAPPGFGNFDSMGNFWEPFHETLYCVEDPVHDWNDCHEQWNNGNMDGFVLTNEPDGRRAMGYYDGSDLGYYWDLFQTFATSDRHFCSALAATWINRYYSLSGTSFGKVHNQLLPMNRYDDPPMVIYQSLDEAGIDWKVYYSDAPFAAVGYLPFYIDNMDHFATVDEFFVDLAAGTLPPVVWIEPSSTDGVERTDEHPPGDHEIGQAWIAGIIDAVMQSAIWPRAAVILTYDEHGGYYDHVAPPDACIPDEWAPELTPGDYVADFERFGLRVPLVAVSPWSKPGYISSVDTDLTSILRLVEARFELPALTARDANAWPMLDLFDFTSPPFLAPPNLVKPTIDPVRLNECHILYP